MSDLDIASQSWRFASLFRQFVVAHTGGRDVAVVVQFDDEDEQWKCYCEDVRFTRLEGRRGTAEFVCAGQTFSRPFALIGPWSDGSMVTPSQVTDVSDEVFDSNGRIKRPDPIRVRIVRWLPHSTKYCIQYKRKASWWPFWWTIHHWIWETWFPCYSWNPVLLEYEAAKRFAASFTDYADICKYDESQKAKEKYSLERRSEHVQSKAPVRCEEIV